MKFFKQTETWYMDVLLYVITISMFVFSKYSPLNFSIKFGPKISLPLSQKIARIVTCQIFSFPKWSEFVFWDSFVDNKDKKTFNLYSSQSELQYTRHSFKLVMHHIYFYLNKEFGEGYRKLITHLHQMFYLWRSYIFDLH